MRRFLRSPVRWAFNLAAAVSAVFFAATCVLWVRCYRTADMVFWTGDAVRGAVWRTRQYQFFSSRGGVLLAANGAAVDASHADTVRGLRGYYDWHPRGWDVGSFDTSGYPFNYAYSPTGFWQALGFEAGATEQVSGRRHDILSRHRWVVFPHWLAAGLFAIAPAAWLAAGFRRRRRQPGRCPTCNYDLRATPERCPECGTEITARGAT
jgi:hypothetical protein